MRPGFLSHGTADNGDGYSVLYRRRQWHPTPVLLPGKSHGWRSLVGCSPWGCKESDMNERLHFPFSLSCIGEGNGSPLQCSYLENPRDGGTRWAAVYGVTWIRTRLKRLSSSSNSAVYSGGCPVCCRMFGRIPGHSRWTKSSCPFPVMTINKDTELPLVENHCIRPTRTYTRAYLVPSPAFSDLHASVH